MLFRREGLPEENDFVVCTVTGIQPHSVFAKLDEYDKTGLIHISEIAPGRIRNIREYVQEGKKVVCKVLRIDRERGHIDLSLRRVNEGQKREKLNELKQEVLAEKIVEHIAHKHKKEVPAVYNAVTDAVFKKYPLLFPAFKDVAEKKADLAAMGVDKEYAADLTEEIRKRLVAEEVSIKGKLTLSTTVQNGIQLIRDALTQALAIDKNITIRYLGNGAYHVGVTAPDYKTAEKILRQINEGVEAFAKKNKMSSTFERQE